MSRISILTVIFKLMFFATPLLAQPNWLEQDAGTSIAVEFLKPGIANSNSTFATSALFLNGRLSLSQTITIVGDVPFAHHGFKNDFGLSRSGASTVIGNPYLGLEIRKQTSPVFVEFGFRLPFGTDRDEYYDKTGASSIGQFIDPERFTAFNLYDLSIMARLNYRRRIGSDVYLHLRGGWTGGGSADGEYGPGGFQTLDYTIQVVNQSEDVDSENVDIVAGLTGSYLLDGSTFHLSRFAHLDRARMAHQIAFALSKGFSTLRPGFYLRVPVSGILRDEISFVLGLNLGVRLN